MFEDDSAGRVARKFPLTLMGAERRIPRARTREQGPPSALAEFFFLSEGFRRVSKICIGSLFFCGFSLRFYKKRTSFLKNHFESSESLDMSLEQLLEMF